MSDKPLLEYIEPIQKAATNACSFVEGMTKADFLEHRRRQQAKTLKTRDVSLPKSYSYNFPDTVWEICERNRNDPSAAKRSAPRSAHQSSTGP